MLVIAVSSPLLALSNVGLAFRSWQTNAGLPENTIQAFAQTPDGFLWVGTTGGLVRFDGDSFTTFDHTTNPVFSESSILSLLAARDGSLWIGTDGGGLIRYRDGEFTRAAQHEPHGRFIRTIFEDREQHLWIGTESGLFSWDGNSQHEFTHITGIAGVDAQVIFEDRNLNLWVGGSQLYCLHDGELRLRPRNNHSQEDPVRSLAQSDDGTLWVGSLSGLSYLREGQPTFKHFQKIDGAVTSLASSDDATLFVGTSGGGLYSIRHNAVSHIDSFPAPARASILSLFADSGHNVWIGTQAGMIEMFHSPAGIIHFPNGARSDSATVYVDSHSTVWVASRRLYVVRGMSLVPAPVPNLPDTNVRCMWREKDNSLWIGTNGDGVYHVTPSRAIHYTTQNGLTNNFIRVIVGGREDPIWIGTDSGISVFEHGAMHPLELGGDVQNESIRAILPQGRGDAWIGTSNGLHHIRNGVFQQDAATRAMKSEKVWSIQSDSRGTLWFGTRYGGLYGLLNNRIVHFTTAQGLVSDSIYKMVDDRKGRLWLSGPSGISSITLNDLYDTDAARQDLHPRAYYLSDGQQPVQLYGGTQPAGWNGSKGDIWFASDHGPVHIVPDHEVLPLPRLRIKQIVVDGRSVSADDKVVLHPDDTTLEISYAPVFLKPQDIMRYQYKLDGFNSNWQDVFGRKTAYFTKLPAGDFTFRVRAFFADQSGSFAETSIRVVREPVFYKTWWFFSLLATLAVLLALGAHLWKVRQVNNRFHVILEERSRVAREVHDTLIQGCASVSAFLEATSNLSDNEKLKHEYLSYARSQIAITMDEARRTVWNLRNGRQPHTDLHSVISGLVLQIGKEFEGKISCRFDRRKCLPDAITLHETTMIVREAMANAIQHSGSSRIEVETHCTSDGLTIAVSDNGIGFDNTDAVREGHYGLEGMRERAAMIGGTFQITSITGKGTTVAITVPVAQ
jgi:ligand-binding sensor domain-containing protein/signal transduction histidine kinase